MIREETMTDEKIDRIWMKPIPDMMPAIEWRRRFARTIERAVLKSPEVQALKEALQWAVGNPDDSAYWIHQAKTELDSIKETAA